MKLVFERDIPAFRGKTWSQKIALRLQAQKLDKRIPLRFILISVCWLPLLFWLIILRQQQIVPSLLWVFLIYSAVQLPFTVLAQAIWVTPLMKQALHPPEA